MAASLVAMRSRLMTQGFLQLVPPDFSAKIAGLCRRDKFRTYM
jgi:hypothetical protein